jgi:K+:H+ antiporter
MLLLYTGRETDLGILRSVGRASIAISWLGIIVPLLTGFALGWEIPAGYLAKPNDRLSLLPVYRSRDVDLCGSGHRKDSD